MKNLSRVIVLLVSGTFLSGALNAAVLTFDDIVSSGVSSVPDGYGGLNWDNVLVLDTANYNVQDSGYVRGTTSGDFAAFNAGAAAIEITSDGGTFFDVLSMNLTAAWTDGLSITLRSYTGAVLRSEITIGGFTQAGPTGLFLNSDYLGIDRLVMESFGGVDAGLAGGSAQHFVLDDLNVNVSVVPIPASAWLFASGLGLLGWMRRPRKAAPAGV